MTIEYRWARGDYSQLPALVADLIQRKAAVIVTGTTPVTRAAKAASTTVPIVFVIGADLVKVGIVPSLNRTGRERYRREFPGQQFVAKTIRGTARDGSQGSFDRIPRESHQSECRVRHEGRASNSGYARAKTVGRSSPHR